MNRIKQLREEKKWNQEQLGVMLNVKRAAVSKYENENIPLTAETIRLLCNIFEVSADYIICKSNTRRPEENTTVTQVQERILDAVKDLSDENIEKLIEYAQLLRKANNN